MHDHVTAIPAEAFVSVDGLDLFFPITAPDGVYAAHWHDGEGYIEFSDPRELDLELSGVDDYIDHILPFVDQWEEEAERLEAEGALPGADAGDEGE